MILRKFGFTIAAVALVAAAGIYGQAGAQAAAQAGASAACNTCSENAKKDSSFGNSPNSGQNQVAVSGTGLNTAGLVGGLAGGAASGGGGGGVGVTGDFKRFALKELGGTGAAAASGGKNWNGWVAYSRSEIGYNFAPLNSSGRVNLYLGGIDYTFDNNVVFGVAVAADRTNVDLNFSGGKLDGKGVTIAPYIGYAFTPKLAIDGTLGIGRTDLNTTVGAVAGSTKSDRGLGSVGLTYREAIGKWQLTGRAAFLAVSDKIKAYTRSDGVFVPESKIDVSQIRLYGQVAYDLGTFTPYAGVSYINDVRHPNQAPVGGVVAANDRDSWTPAIGIRFKTDGTVYGSIQYSSERGRSEVKNNQLLLNLGLRF